MGKMSTLTHFKLESGCEDYSFLDQALTDFENGLDFILTGSVETAEMDASFDEHVTITSSISLGF